MLEHSTAAAIAAAQSRDGFASLRSEAAAGRHAHAWRVLDERGAAEQMVRDQYTGRYPLELLQNANDAAASPGASGRRVRFVVTPTALLVADEGAGFGPDQVRAICGLARSSKDPRKSIGHKGLGFKSVREITDCPQIVSHDVAFGFDVERLRCDVEAILGPAPHADQRLPDYAFPYELGAEHLGSDATAVRELHQAGFGTIFRLPFRNGVSHRAVARDVCESLDPRVLLFLDALDCIEVIGTDQDFVAEIDRDADPADPAAVRLHTEANTERFLVYSTTVAIPDPALVATLGRSWSQVESVRIAAAVPLDADGRPAREIAEKVRVYFPTEESPGLPLLLNGDFQTELDRRRISSTADHRPYNEWLCSELAAFVTGEVAERLVCAFPGDPAASACLVPARATGEWGEALRARLVARLRTAPVFLRRDGLARPAHELRLLPPAMPSTEFVHTLLPDLDALIHRDLNASRRISEFLRDELLVRDLPGPAVARALRPGASTDSTTFYAFVLQWEQAAGGAMRSWLSEATCVRLLDGTWVTPASAPFFPRQRGEIEFPTALHLPIVDLEGVSDIVRMLLEQAGVQRFEWGSLVPRFLIPLLESERTTPDVRDAALRALRQYADADGSNVEIQKLLGRVRLPAARTNGTGETLLPAAEIYFSDAWDPAIETSAIYGPFDRAEFLSVPVPESAADRQADMDFYDWLGVERQPRLVPVAAFGDSDDHSGITNRAIRSWRQSHEFKAASSCGQGHSQSQTLTSSFHIDRLTDLIATQDADRLAALWRAMGSGWTSRYAAALTSTFRCRAGAHVGSRERNLPSFLGNTLHEAAWVPLESGANTSLAKPSDVWDPGKARPSVRARVAGLPDNLRRTAPTAMLVDLGVLDAGRINATRLISFLRQLQDEATSAGSVSEDLADAARWAIGRLDRCLADGDHIDGPIPLLARSDGELVLTPDVVLCHDVTLAEAWDDVAAMFVPEDAWTAIASALGLEDLAATITTTSELLERDTDREQQLQHSFEASLPELLALASDRAREREIELAGLLRRIVIHAGRRLERYDRYRGETRSRGNSAVHLDASAERTIALVHLDSGGDHDPFAFGRELASYLDRPQIADALGILLDSHAEVRQRYLRSRNLLQESVDRAIALIQESDPRPQKPGAAPYPEPVADPVQRDEPTAAGPATKPAPDSSASEYTPGQSSTSENDSRSQTPPAAPPTHPGEIKTGTGTSPTTPIPSCGPAVPHPRPDPSIELADTGDTAAGSMRRTGHDRKLVSYVSRGGRLPSGDASVAVSHRVAVDRAGLDAVLTFERLEGRFPEEQEHDNPGFDVLSYDEDDNVVRVIEVKSTDGPWGARGVTMSAPQLARNRSDGDRFWLYVVEHALDDECRAVHPIQNPADQITDYAFDDGWRAVADRASTPTSL